MRIGIVASCQKLGIILVSKWFENWCDQKMPITKNVLLNYYFSMKKNERDSDDFWLWKLNFGTFWHQFSQFNNFLWVCWFLNKNTINFTWDSITGIAITCKYFLPTFVCSSQIHPYLCHWISVICLLKSRWFQWFKSKVEFHPSRTLKSRPFGLLLTFRKTTEWRRFCSTANSSTNYSAPYVSRAMK